MLGGIDLKSKMERCVNCKNRFQCLTDNNLVCATALQKEELEYFKNTNGGLTSYGTSFAYSSNIRIDYEPIKEADYD